MKGLLPSEKTSWILLTLLFTFDNLVSYWAIVYRGGHEGNLLIAPIVEKYPLLYFLCIPLTLLIIYVIVWVIQKVATFILKKLGFKSSSGLRKIILAAIVIYWAIANSSLNVVFLTGYRFGLQTFTAFVWPLTTGLGILLALTYSLYFLRK